MSGEVRSIIGEDVLNRKTPEPWKSSPEKRYGIRRFNPNSSEDTQRLNDMNRHPFALEWLDSEASEDVSEVNVETDWMARIDETSKFDPRLLLAIVNDENKPVGWVMFYKDGLVQSNPVARDLEIDENSLVLELSYVKLFKDNWSDANFIEERDNLEAEQPKGVVVEGLDQALLYLKEKETRISLNSKIPQRPIVMTAYTDPNNTASEAVLTKNGFSNEGLIDYDGELTNLWIKKL